MAGRGGPPPRKLRVHASEEAKRAAIEAYQRRKELAAEAANDPEAHKRLMAELRGGARRTYQRGSRTVY